MLNEAISVLQTLGIYDAIRVIAVAMAAIFIYKYFTDRQ